MKNKIKNGKYIVFQLRAGNTLRLLKLHIEIKGFKSNNNIIHIKLLYFDIQISLYIQISMYAVQSSYRHSSHLQ